MATGTKREASLNEKEEMKSPLAKFISTLAVEDGPGILYLVFYPPGGAVIAAYTNSLTAKQVTMCPSEESLSYVCSRLANNLEFKECNLSTQFKQVARFAAAMDGQNNSVNNSILPAFFSCALKFTHIKDDIKLFGVNPDSYEAGVMWPQTNLRLSLGYASGADGDSFRPLLTYDSDDPDGNYRLKFDPADFVTYDFVHLLHEKNPHLYLLSTLNKIKIIEVQELTTPTETKYECFTFYPDSLIERNEEDKPTLPSVAECLWI